MEKRNFGVAAEEVEVLDGKVVITSEELARAIQEQEVNLSEEDEAGLSINFGCKVSAVR